MKIALLLPANKFFCPYSAIYEKILIKAKIHYDIISWNKNDIVEDVDYSFNFKIRNSDNFIKKNIGYFKYSRFLKKIIKKNEYDKLIVFGPQIGIFIYPFLKKYYSNKIIFDYRDLSIDMYFPTIFKNLLKISNLRIISSPGFERILPKGFQYILSHNFNIDILRETVNKSNVDFLTNKMRILTIGALRNFDQSLELIEEFANDDNIILDFVGKGTATEPLKEYTLMNKINNVFFTGYYDKKDESSYFLSSSFINIYYPRILSHDTALSNRFYNAIIYCRPMITTSDTIQGDFTDQYYLGITVNNCFELKNKIIKFKEQFDEAKYLENRLGLLNKFIEDYDIFEKNIFIFLEKMELGKLDC